MNANKWEIIYVEHNLDVSIDLYEKKLNNNKTKLYNWFFDFIILKLNKT